ncbi:hypothetical protein CSB20_00010 [bacterium DOLZORAL124_64_63]|nr:MAG: hypothetical protein CSB20_00010 [bacterium DOLZORAL124_64_63]
MVKIILKLVLVLVVVAAGSLGDGQAVAAQDDLALVIPQDDQTPPVGNPVFEMNGGIAGGHDGDPDSAGDGLGCVDDFFAGLADITGPNDELWEELLLIWLESLLIQP